MRHSTLDLKIQFLQVRDLLKNLFLLTAAAARGVKADIMRNECVVKRGGIPVVTDRKQRFLLYLT